MPALLRSVGSHALLAALAFACVCMNLIYPRNVVFETNLALGSVSWRLQALEDKVVASQSESARGFERLLNVSASLRRENQRARDTAIPPLPDADPEFDRQFGDICERSSRPPEDEHCVLQKVAAGPSENIKSCSPFEGGSNALFGLKWCAWNAREDGHISQHVLNSTVPPAEVGPMRSFMAALAGKPRGIVVDAGAQVGLFTAAALASGHYTVSIDARQEHVHMNLASWAINNVTERDGMIVHGALSDRCGQWATIPREQQYANNPGATNVVGRVTDGWPRFETRDAFYQFEKVPVLTLDHIMQHVMKRLPAGVARKLYALKLDIEGYEPRAVMGASRLFMHMKPDLIVMELFVHRFRDCDAKKLIRSIARTGYRVDVEARLHLSCPNNSCKGMTDGPELDAFFGRLRNNSEMDILFHRVP